MKDTNDEEHPDEYHDPLIDFIERVFTMSTTRLVLYTICFILLCIGLWLCIYFVILKCTGITH